MGLHCSLYNLSQVFKAKQCLGKQHAVVFQGFILSDWVIGFSEYLGFEISQTWHITASQILPLKIWTIWRSPQTSDRDLDNTDSPQFKKDVSNSDCVLSGADSILGTEPTAGSKHLFRLCMPPVEVFYFSTDCIWTLKSSHPPAGSPWASSLLHLASV